MPRSLNSLPIVERADHDYLARGGGYDPLVAHVFNLALNHIANNLSHRVYGAKYSCAFVDDIY
jgi:hypothetical protein